MKMVITGSATGGHLYPAIAIADKLCLEDSSTKILFIGAKNEIGTEIIAASGYLLEKINLNGFDRKRLYKNISVLGAIALADMKIKKILKDFAPDGVVSTGGYTGGPVVRAAAALKIPTFIHEQNVIPGVSNKLAARYADRIYLGFEEAKKYFKYKNKLLTVGNPVRNEFKLAKQIDYRKEMEINGNKKILLIFGGSQGADTINDLGMSLCERYFKDEDIIIYFITGKRNYWDIFKKMEGLLGRSDRLHILDYMTGIHELFSVADLIVSRAGALSVSEIAYMGKPSVLIPSPNVTANHQYFNALTLKDAGAAVVVEEKDLNIAALIETIDGILANEENLSQMSEAASVLARPKAVEDIYEDIRAHV